MVRAAWDLDSSLAIIGPLKLVSDPRGIVWYQHTLAGEGDLLRSHQGKKLVRQSRNKVFCFIFVFVVVGLSLVGFW